MRTLISSFMEKLNRMKDLRGWRTCEHAVMADIPLDTLGSTITMAMANSNSNSSLFTLLTADRVQIAIYIPTPMRWPGQPLLHGRSALKPGVRTLMKVAVCSLGGVVTTENYALARDARQSHPSLSISDLVDPLSLHAWLIWWFFVRLALT